MSERPEAATEDWQRLSPLSILTGFLRSGVNALLPAGVILYTALRNNDIPGLGMLAIVPIVMGIALIAITVDALGWYRQRYRVGEADIRHEKGLISRSARSVPFERIQDVSLEEKLVPRLLGLVEVRFETGAGGKDELKLAYVTRKEGEKLRETVRQRHEGEAAPVAGSRQAIQQNAQQHAGPASEPEAGRILFTMAPGRLFTFGLFEFSLIVLAVLSGAVQQFEFLLPFDIWDFDLWRDQYEQRGPMIAGFEQFGLIGRFLGFAAVLPALIILGLVTGVVRTFLRDYDFRLERTAKGFRRRRGLLTRTDVVMPVHRVQAVKVTTGVLRRLFGWHGLSFISLAQDAGSSNHDVAPFARMVEIAPIVSEAGFALPDERADWHRPSPLFYADRAVVWVAISGLACVVAIVSGETAIGLALVALGAILSARQYWLWRVDRHALDPRQVLCKRGWLSPRLLIASRIRLHSVEIAQGPIARWRGYASLHFGLAGGRLSFRGLPLDEARYLRAAALDSIAAVDFARLPR